MSREGSAALTRDAIVVAVGSGDHGYEAGLRFAVQEARRTARPLHLVHVVMRPRGPFAEVWLDQDLLARTLVREAVEHAESLGGHDLVVTGSVVDNGFLVRSLVETADAGSMAVLQHRRLNAAHRLVTRSVANGVAARVRVPVVAVPEDWRPRPGHDRVVTVAVQDVAESRALVATGAQIALQHGARLDVLHAWWMANGLDTLMVDQGLRTDWTGRIRRELEPALDETRARHPGLTLALTVVHAPAAQALLDAAARSDLLVVGRRHHHLPPGTHLGPVARSVLDHSVCPVLIAPEVEVAAGAADDEPLAPYGSAAS